ncbi:MAG: FAD-dependent oxidoreductase [Clostridia bacterium]|jgi:NADPH-dependent 2,4-dienoyl-CoA reductase/sulfur reductase-like enzyme/rhodanese-related sulfurtransferase|nr:FAD-dependent oxidoreductase [Clostridia bacterium]
MKIVIVGGVAAGASAATKARRVNEEAEIVVLEKGPYVSFANCGLPYYVGGDIPRKENLLLVTPRLFKQRFNIDIRINHEAVAVDPARKMVTVQTEGGEIQESYDKLILATGSKPALPEITGLELPGVHSILTVPDVERITENLSAGVSSVIVLGGGFIGVESAEAFLNKGVKTTLVHRSPALMKTYDPEFSLPLEAELFRLGLNLVLGKKPRRIVGKEKVEGLELEDGTVIPADMIISAVGVKPRTELAVSAGLEIGKTGGIVVDEMMRTSVPDIYAAGDIVESVHLVSGKRCVIPLAGPANKQGRIAGANAVGGTMKFKGVLGTSIIKAGEITLARTGLREAEARELGLAYHASFTSSFSHATYYPGARQMIIKIIFEKETGRILGAQGVGYAGVDKRIDILATAIYAGLTVYDLEHLDLAYAPPYSSAKDPSIMAGMVGANILRGEFKHVTPQDLPELQKKEDILLLDVRSKGEYEQGAIAGALSISVDQLRQRYQELDTKKKIVVYCKVGYRAYIAARFLMQKGFDVYNLSGGYDVFTMKVN